jgi:membrane protein implicated in regulation of membrane protease activity
LSQTTLWIVLAGVLLVAEMTTGTFYLLLFALGAGLGAILSWMGLGVEFQITAAAIFAAGTSFLLKRSRSGQTANAQSDKLDIGNTVYVENWGGEGLSPGRAKVTYRGSTWSAISLDVPPRAGAHNIVNVNGSTLELKAIQS